MIKKLKRMLRKLFTTKEMRWRHWERSIHNEYKPLIASAKTADEREELSFQYHEELREMDRDRRDYTDSKLISKARRHYIPIPLRQEEDGLWMEWEEGSWYLTEKGVHHLRKEIREEQKATRDLMLGWTPLITTIIGLIGVLIALISIIRN